MGRGWRGRLTRDRQVWWLDPLEAASSILHVASRAWPPPWPSPSCGLLRPHGALTQAFQAPVTEWVHLSKGGRHLSIGYFASSPARPGGRGHTTLIFLERQQRLRGRRDPGSTARAPGSAVGLGRALPSASLHHLPRFPFTQVTW